MNKPQRTEGFVVDEPDDKPTIENTTPAIADANGEALPEESWPIKVRLIHKPVKNNKGDLVRELEFREPTGNDINRVGCPVRVTWEGEVIIDDRRMFAILANLSGILQPNLERMDPRDYQSCAYRLRGFFMPSTAGWGLPQQ